MEGLQTRIYHNCSKSSPDIIMNGCTLCVCFLPTTKAQGLDYHYHYNWAGLCTTRLGIDTKE